MSNVGRNRPQLTLSPGASPPLAPVPLEGWSDGWAAAKQIDGLGGEWTYPVMAHRASNFHTWMADPSFYAPIEDFDRLLLETYIRQQARENGVDWSSSGDVGVVIRLFPSIYDSPDGRVPMPAEGEASIGLHSVNVIAVEGNDGLVFTHGWSGWARGDNIGYLSREYMDAYVEEMWTSTFCDRGPLRETANDLLSGVADSNDLWHRPRPEGHENDLVTGSRLRWFQTWNLSSESKAEVLVLEVDVAPGAPVRAGVAVVIHDLASKQSRIIDLFIWPPYRRRGYGRALERFAYRRIAAVGRNQIAGLIWNADTILDSASSVKFAEACGYKVVEMRGSGMSHLATRRFPRARRR